MVWFLAWLSACRAEGPSVDILRGECDASAVVRLDDGLLVASDETTSLARYDASGRWMERLDLAGPLGAAMGAPLEQGDDGPRELDLEGAERVGDRIWWLGSHGLDQKGRVRRNRRVLFATGLPQDGAIEVVQGPWDLLPALWQVPVLGPRLIAVADRPPKRGGLDLEGLGVDPATGDLLLGLRSPLDEGRATVVALNPDALTDPSTPPPLRIRATLDLGGRGIRGMAWSASRAAWILVAGPPGDEGTFALYLWDGQQTVRPLDATLGDLRPEGLAEVGDGWILVSDDGGVYRDGADCKDHRAKDPNNPAVYARVLHLSL